MKFADSIKEALDTKWSFINSFDVRLVVPNRLASKVGWDEVKDGRNLNLNVVSIDTPQFTNSPIESFVANRWVLHNGRDEVYRFSITFRDRDQMDLYRKFVGMYQLTKEIYFDDAAMTVLLSKDGDWLNETDALLFRFEDTIIENVSQVQFSNTTENQIAEFTVGFKCVNAAIVPNGIGGRIFSASIFDYIDFFD